jgi:hypothetical protein
MNFLSDRCELFSDVGTNDQPNPMPIDLRVERVRDAEGDQIHVVVDDARVVFASDHFLEILRKLQWAVAIDRGLEQPRV